MEDNGNDIFSGSFDKIKGAGKLARLKIYQDYITRISKLENLKLAEKKHFDELDREFSEELDSEETKETFSSADVMAKLGISDRSRKWHTTRGNLKRNKNGTYPLSSILEFEQKYKRKTASSGKGLSLVDKQEAATLRYRISRAEWQEANVKQLQGKLISIEDMAREWGLRLNTLFSGVMIWEHRLSPRLVGKTQDEISVILRDEIYLLMKTFSEKGRYCPEIDGALKIDNV